MENSKTSLMTVPAEIVPFFLPADKLLSLTPLGDGNINNTFLVEFLGRSPVVLQQINKEVFPDPAIVADNVRLVTEHIHQKLTESDQASRTIQLIQTRKGENSHRDEHNNIWRMIDYVENTVVHSSGISAEHAFEGGKILGRFHHFLDDLNHDQLREPLPYFHNLPVYGSRYCQVRAEYDNTISTELAFCLIEADRRLDQVAVLEDACRSGRIFRRVIHGDPKLANMLFDEASGRGVTMIDFDTVSQGLLHYDLGDCLRSFCNTLGENPQHCEAVTFDLDLCELVLSGYSESGAMLSDHEKSLLYQGVRLLTYELGLRFLTDYLEGNRYFKVEHEHDNIRRAMTQFHLLKSIEQEQPEIESIAAAL